jgi:hypothetical protein
MGKSPYFYLRLLTFSLYHNKVLDNIGNLGGIFYDKEAA